MRKLTLRSEALAELTSEDLSSVAGGTLPLTNTCVSVRCSGVTCLLSDGGLLCVEGR
jgi:hypothetical protein